MAIEQLIAQADVFDFKAYLETTGENAQVKMRYFQELGILLYAKHKYPDKSIEHAITAVSTIYNSSDGTLEAYMQEFTIPPAEIISEHTKCGGCGGGEVR